MAKRKKKGKTVKALHVLQPNAAGIDIGATEIYIAVPEDRCDETIGHFLAPLPKICTKLPNG